MNVFNVSGLRDAWQGLFVRWVTKRSKIAPMYTLHRKNLYIFPTLTGSAFFSLALVVWLLGTNYQNNLILALAYMQVSLFVIVILNTYNNLSGLEVKINGAKSACVGELVEFEFTVHSPNRIGSHYISVGWRSRLKSGNSSADTFIGLFDFPPKEANIIKVSGKAMKRGYYQPKFLFLESTFPMGLLRCWTWLCFDNKAIVYPKPLECSLPKNNVGGGDEEEGCSSVVEGGDDFVGFTQYQPGDSPKHIAWALYARERGLYRKQYGAASSQHFWLMWSDFYRGDVETCLSNMCYWAMRFNKQFQAFGVLLPDQKIPIAEGDTHLREVLTAFALFQERPSRK